METTFKVTWARGNQFEALARQLVARLNGWNAAGMERNIMPVKTCYLDFDSYRRNGRLAVVRMELERFSEESNRIMRRPFETVTTEIEARFVKFANLGIFDPEIDVQILTQQLRQEFGA